MRAHASNHQTAGNMYDLPQKLIETPKTEREKLRQSYVYFKGFYFIYRYISILKNSFSGGSFYLNVINSALHSLFLCVCFWTSWWIESRIVSFSLIRMCYIHSNLACGWSRVCWFRWEVRLSYLTLYMYTSLQNPFLPYLEFCLLSKALLARYLVFPHVKSPLMTQIPLKFEQLYPKCNHYWT